VIDFFSQSFFLSSRMIDAIGSRRPLIAVKDISLAFLIFINRLRRPLAQRE